MGYKGITEYTPLCNNRYLYEVQGRERTRKWERQGINRIIQLYEGSTLKLFTDLRREFNISKKSFYKYLQIRHALQVQFKTQVIEWSKIPTLQKIINLGTTKGLISEIYSQLGSRNMSGAGSSKSRAGWERDVGEITI